MPAVGKRLADKIWEIVSSGHLRRLDHIDEKQAMVDMFGKIWGVGPTCAQRFVALVRHACLLVRVFVYAPYVYDAITLTSKIFM